ncbi:rCG23337, isoform CRA_b [Rattus norvegicus]|uniref:RCG23337, isoform CRA_b n=1 Tax=Rattus norvegicus TaxID=10116 RepID=A6JQ34_RAT|nr:rCG23337, isoform CRA_b [Rattus norvegicus]
MWRLNSKLCSRTGSSSETLVYQEKEAKSSQQSLTFRSSRTSRSGWRFCANTLASECLWMDTSSLIFTIVSKRYLQLTP